MMRGARRTVALEVSVHRYFLILVLLESGCTALNSSQVNTISTKPFKQSERSIVYARSLTAFQVRGMFISMSEPNGGILRTEAQRSRQTCSNTAADLSGERKCWAVEQTQLTLGADGNAFLRINRTVIGYTTVGEAPMTPKDYAGLQQECDALLDFIVGTSPQPPAPPPAPGLLPLALRDTDQPLGATAQKLTPE